MSTIDIQAESRQGGSASFEPRGNPIGTIIRFLLLAVIDSLALIMVYGFFYTGSPDTIALGIVITLITIGANVVVFVPALYPLKWMLPGLVLVSLLVIFPIYYTIQTAFTNYGDGHLFTKDNAISLISERGYVPEGATTFEYAPFVSGDDYALWLRDEDNLYFALPGEDLREVSLADLGITRNEDAPPTVDGYEIAESTAVVADESSISFSEPIGTVRVEALDLDTRFLYDIEQNLVFDQEEGETYEITFFENDLGEYFIWMLETGSVVNDAFFAFPGQDLQEFALDANDITRAGERLGFDIARNGTIPRNIDQFERVGTPTERDELATIALENISDGFRGEAFDLEQQYILDPAQGITLDTTSGDVFETTIYTNDAGEFGIYLDAGRSGQYLSLADDRSFIASGQLTNGIFAPTEFDGFELVYTLRGRNEALSFLQNAERDYFGGFPTGEAPAGDAEDGDTAVAVTGSQNVLGVIDTRRTGLPFLLRYVHNTTEDALIDLSSIDDVVDVSNLEPDALTTVNLFTEPGFINATIYDANDETGDFDPSRIRLIFNESAGGYVDMFSVNLNNPGALSAEDIASAPVLPAVGINGATLFNDFPGQNVFAEQGYIYNETAAVFVDASGSEADPETLQTASLGALDEIEDITVYRLHNDTAMYIPNGYSYNEPSNSFFDLNAAELIQEDLTGLNLEVVETESFAQILEAPRYLFFEDAGVYAPVEFEYDATTNTFDDTSPGGDLYILEEETDLFVPETFIYNTASDLFINTDDVDIEALGDIDPATINFDDLPELIAAASEEQAAALSDLIDASQSPGRLQRDLELLYDDTDLFFNAGTEQFVYLPNVDLSGIDVESANLDVITALDEARPVPAILNNIGDFLYYTTLNFSDTNDDKTYVLGSASRADELRPGYRVNVGLDNFTQLAEDRTLLEPLIQVFIWTVIFALLSVFLSFTVGLFMALILNDARIPGKKIIRSLLIIPYAIPGVIGILVWRGMLNENLGIVTNTIEDWFGLQILWFSDATIAKITILLVNTWLGYPYMMLVCSGALQAIPSDVYEAAAVDGAKPNQRFWNITLPLLLITVGPLLIASFTFNFNNYLIIEALTGGDPPIPGTSTPAGETDILISYTYNLAFGGQGADYGYASAITLVIFALVALITLFQYRFTRQWEEVGENV